MTEDEMLVKQTLAGEKKAFGKLVRKYQSAVYGLCYHIVGNFADAQDLAQEAFVQAYCDLHQLREPSKFANWLYRLTRNVCGMWFRRQKKSMMSFEELSSEDWLDSAKTVTPHERVEEEMHQFIRQAIDSLSEKNRLAVTLFYMDGLSYQNISDFLGVPVTTVKSRLYEARQKIKEELVKMMKKTFEEHKLPEDFADSVLQEVEVTKVAFDTPSETPIVFLTNKADSLQYLPIWIGQPEGDSILRVLENKETARPMTHDLFINTLRECGIKLQAVIVTELRESTFYGKLVLEYDGETKEVDSRPSDAINLALRVDAPIFVEQSTFNQGSVWLPAFESGVLPEEFSKQVNQLINNFQIPEAIEKYKSKLRELEEKPDENAEMIPLFYFDIAELYQRIGRYDDAIKNCEKALPLVESDNSKAQIYRKIGKNYRRQKMHEKSISAVKKALEIFPSDRNTLFELGISYANNEQWDDAIVQFQKVLQMDERDVGVRLFLADRYFKIENYEQAKEEYRKCIEFQPDSGVACVRLSDTQKALGEYSEALDTLKEAISKCQFENRGDFTVFVLDRVEKLYRKLDRESEFVEYCRNAIAEKMDFEYGPEKVSIKRAGKEKTVVVPPKTAIERIRMAVQMDWWLGEYFQRHGDSEAAHTQYEKLEKLGLIMEENWHVIGPFDNTDDSGFSTEYPPEHEIDFEKSYQGISGEVHWQRAQRGRSKSCVDFASILGVKEWATAYAYTTIHSDEEKDAQLKFGSKDSVVIWLNGNRIGRITPNFIRRFSIPDQGTILIKLKKGENRLLIKSCVSASRPIKSSGELPAGFELSAEWCIFVRIVEKNQ